MDTKKCLITKIGIASVEQNMAQGWWMESQTLGESVEIKPDMIGGYTVGELESIAYASDLFVGALEGGDVTITIPAGYYSPMAFFVPYSPPQMYMSIQ